jgi:phosphatidylserine/phosphatidylglycerophosphate/cardiolipin synthase-like enzyme
MLKPYTVHIAFLVVFGSIAFQVDAQTPIAQARDLAVGTVVTVRGIVTNGSELGGIRYMQDGTGGIAAFPGTGSTSGFSPQRGTDISVTGPLKLFNGLLEIDPVQAFTVHSTNNPLPVPQLIEPNGMGESTESELVRINGCAIQGAGGTFTSGTIGFASNSQSGNLFLRSGHPLIGNTIPAGIVDLIGLVSQFSSSTPPVGGYQLLLRNSADILTSTTLSIIGEVQQSSITPSGFVMSWNTNLVSNARVRYGLTPALGSLATAAPLGTAHSVQLSGLQPAQAYYAQAFSVLGTDTAFAPVRLYSTASADPGSITVYFNKAVDESVATGPLAINLGSAIDDTIKAYMDRALSTIDVAVYNTTSSLLVSAANDARARGVQVRWIAEASNSNSALQNLVPAIPVLYRTNSTGSGMHNKFVIIDADGGPDSHVLTGSANFTNAGFFLDPNNLVIIQDMALARAYRTEFEEMWGGPGALPNVSNSRFGADKTDNTPHLFNVNGTLIRSAFSPSDGTTTRIVEALNTADERIEFALFALTNSTLSEALIDMQARPNVLVRGMVEEDDLTPWIFDALLAGGVDVRPDGDPTSLHHKYAIVDRGAPTSDPLVITGSHNWSFNAENFNDENTLFIHSDAVADQFHQEWNARWTTAVTINEQGPVGTALQIWPNPSSGFLNVALPFAASSRSTAQVLDLAGRVVYQQHLDAGSSVIDVRPISTGVYILRIESDGFQAQGTFIRAY